MRGPSLEACGAIELPHGLSLEDAATLGSVAAKLRHMARDGAGSAGITRRGMRLYAVRENGAWVPRGATPPLMRMACAAASGVDVAEYMRLYALDEALDAALPADTEPMLI